MPGTRRGLVLVFLAAQVGSAGEVPDPLFWPSESAFLAQVTEGQFDPHLELHLVQYAMDPRWAQEWAARRYSGNGLAGEYGSTSARNLYVNGQIALNLFPAKWLQIRYDRRDYQDGRFDFADQRFEVAWRPSPGFALVITGWPTHLKEEASGGIGLRVGEPGGASGLALTVVDDRFVWNEKNESGLEFTRSPLRVVADGHVERGPWRAQATVDYGLEYEATEGSSATGPPPSTRGAQRFGDVAVSYSSGEWRVGGRWTGASLDRSQETQTTGRCRLTRSWSRIVAQGRRDLGRWSVEGLAGWARQRDAFFSPAVADGTYDQQTWLVGLEGSLRIGGALEMRLGCLGSSVDAERVVADPAALPGQSEDIWADKAHVRALYTFGPGMSVELLLSQTLTGSRFGGGSIKALLVF